MNYYHYTADGLQDTSNTSVIKYTDPIGKENFDSISIELNQSSYQINETKVDGWKTLKPLQKTWRKKPAKP